VITETGSGAGAAAETGAGDGVGAGEESGDFGFTKTGGFSTGGDAVSGANKLCVSCGNRGFFRRDLST